MNVRERERERERERQRERERERERETDRERLYGLLEQGGIFIVPQLLEHGASVCAEKQKEPRRDLHWRGGGSGWVGIIKSQT